jgi:hypothetical protein
LQLSPRTPFCQGLYFMGDNKSRGDCSRKKNRG